MTASIGSYLLLSALALHAGRSIVTRLGEDNIGTHAGRQGRRGREFLTRPMNFGEGKEAVVGDVGEYIKAWWCGVGERWICKRLTVSGWRGARDVTWGLVFPCSTVSG